MLWRIRFYCLRDQIPNFHNTPSLNLAECSLLDANITYQKHQRSELNCNKLPYIDYLHQLFCKMMCKIQGHGLLELEDRWNNWDLIWILISIEKPDSFITLKVIGELEILKTRRQMCKFKFDFQKIVPYILSYAQTSKIHSVANRQANWFYLVREVNYSWSLYKPILYYRRFLFVKLSYQRIDVVENDMMMHFLHQSWNIDHSFQPECNSCQSPQALQP